MAISSQETFQFTSESVSMGHPDKVCDQISDAVLDSLLAVDPKARVACETLVTTGLVVLAGEVTVHNQKALEVLSNVEQTAREAIREIGYDDPSTGFDYRSCAVLRTLHSQSADISQGVTAETSLTHEQGAGDQGIMFGFACNETPELMPAPIHYSHRIVEKLADLREKKKLKWLRPDSKSQVTLTYAKGKPVSCDAVVLSTQHDESVCEKKGRGNMTKAAEKALIDEVIRKVIPAKLLTNKTRFLINPTGRFVIGGPHGDSGLTGRKIIVDTYGGRGRHGGGAFSGKDPSKVDRSAAYMGRYIAKNVVAAGLADICEVQVSYAIGYHEPTSVLVMTEGTGKIPEKEISDLVREHFPLRPAQMIAHLDLLKPIYRQTARHGHFGRKPTAEGHFSWEKIDIAPKLRKAAGLK